MPHPSEAALIAFADDELDAGVRGEVASHVEGCGLCRHALRDLRDAMGALAVETALVDAAEPSSWRTGPAVRPRPDARPLSLVGEVPRPPAPSRRAMLVMRWAATLAIFVAGGAAAMTAPQWMHLLRGTEPSASASVATAPATVAPTTLRATASAAVSVLPVEGEATVSLLGNASAADARVIVRASDRRDVQVTVTTPTSTERVPRFLTGDGRLEVQLAGAGSVVEVDFPSSLRDARVTHDGRAVVTVRRGAVLPAQAATTGISLVGQR